MSTTDDLLTNALAYEAAFDKGDLPLPPARKVAVLACMDARLNPYGILGLQEGDAHVIRNAGGVVTDDEIRSLAISQRLLGTEEIILIHHTDCGMLTFTDDEFKRGIQDEVGIKPGWAAEAFGDLHEDVRQSLARIRASPFIPRKESVRGFVYHVENGELHEVGAAAPQADGAPAAEPVAAASTTDELLRNAAAYEAAFDKGELPLPPARRVAVLACMDARLNPYGILGLQEGDAHVIRNAGGVVTDDEIRSLAISQRLLGTEEIILIHHTDCGMLTFTDDEFKRGIQDEVGIKPKWPAEAFGDLHEDVRQSIARIKANPFIPRKDSVRGFVYHVENGELHEVHPVAAAATSNGSAHTGSNGSAHAGSNGGATASNGGGRLALGDAAPDFVAETTEGQIRFHDWIGDSWAVLFSHPRNFTPVCSTELGYLARIKPEFDRRGVKIIGLSVDPVENHETWVDDIVDITGSRLNYPLIGDHDFTVSKLYGLLPADVEGDPAKRTPADNQTVRNVFVIGPDKKVKLLLVYPMTTGRNFDEVLRVIDSLRLTAEHKVATPAQWRNGDDVIITGAVSDEEARETFPEGWDAPRPYIRIVAQPR